MQRSVLWGHHLDEYKDMFDLPEASLSLRFLEYQSGASAFQRELRQEASYLVSYDTWFALDKAALAATVQQSFETRLAEIQASPAEFDLKRYGSLDALIAYRRAGVAEFLEDYALGHAEGRYVPVSAVRLPFDSFFYDFAVSAHYFFAQCALLTVDACVQQIIELARVAKEVRIFPLVDAQGIPSPLLGPVLLALREANYGVEVREVTYHLQPKGNAMLRVWAEVCQV